MLKNLKEIFLPYKRVMFWVFPMLLITGAIIIWGCDRNDLPSVLFDSKNIVDIHLEEVLDNSKEGFEDQYEYYHTKSEDKEEETLPKK